MKAFVTGSTGLLGSNLVRLLLAQGHQVKALARSEEKAERFLGDTAAEIVVGDMQNVAGFAPEMTECDVLFHCAAYFREYFGAGDHWSTLQKINVNAVVEILTAAEEQGVKKAIHVSSSGIIGMMGDLPGDESTPPSHIAYENLYFKSKILAEEAVQQFLQNHKLPVVLILPGWMVGPNDTAPTHSGQMILDLLHGKMPGLIDGGSSTVDARDIAQAMIDAVKRGRNGERYIVGGNFYTLAELGETITAVTNIPVTKRHIPYPVALATAWVSQTVARLRNTDTLMTVSGIKTMSNHMKYNSSKAQRELGITFRPLAETIADEIHWFAENGYLKSEVRLPETAVTAPTIS